MAIQTISLPAGQVLTVTAVKASTLYRMTGATPGTPTAIAAEASSAVGPFGDARVYAVDSESEATYAITTPGAGGDALIANPLSQFAATTSAQMAGNLTNETGTGALVFATSPTLVTPALGTPASGVMTNVTGTAAGLTAGTVTTNANLTGPITSTGNGTAVAAQTGTGSVFVMQASPTLTTPNIGAATCTSLSVGADQVVGAQGIAVADASGGAVVDAEARTALNALLARLRTHGLIDT